MGLIQKAFGDIITFSRSSNATRIGPNGLVQYAPHNLFTYSEDFSNAAWAKTACTVTTNAIASPNGTVTADLIQLGAGTTSKNLVATVTTTSPCTMTVYAKAGSHSVLQLLNSGTANHFCNFDLNAGAIGNSGSGTTGSIVSAGNGWYRCTATFNSTIGTGFWIVAADATGNGYNATTSSTGTYYIWGAQLSVGSVPGDYTPTTSAAVYGPRFDFDPVTLAARGLLIEEQRTNLLLQSNSFQTTWGENSGILTISQNVTGPDGVANSAWTFTDALTGNQAGRFQNVSLTSGTVYTFSVYVKKTTAAQTVYPVMYALSASGVAGVALNTTTGTSVQATLSGYATLTISSSVQSVGEYWRLIGSFTANSTGSWNIAILPAGSDSSGAISSTFTNTAVFFGAQLEAGAFATSYIPTVASTVTRSADVASVNTLSPWYNQSEGSFYIEAQMALDTSGNAPSLVSVDDGTVQNHQAVYLISGATHRFAYRIRTGNVSQADFFIDQAGSTAGAIVKLSAAYKVNDFAGDKNGGTVETDTVGTVPTVTNLKIADYVGDSLTANGWYRRIAYYPRRLTNAELQAITA